MEWMVFELGEAKVVGADDRGLIVDLRGSGPSYARLTEAGIERLDAEPPRGPPELGPFSLTPLGKKQRLAWPNGATAISQYDHVTAWDDRYAVVLDERGFTVIDAEADRLVRLMFVPEQLIRWQFANPVARAGRLWIGAISSVISIPLADLEQLGEHVGTVEVSLRSAFPLRRPDARLEVVYLWKLQSGRTMVEIGSGNGGAREPKLEIDLPGVGLAKYSRMTLCDELTPDHYAVADVPGQGRHAIAAVDKIRMHAAKVTKTRAKDPVAVSAGPKVTSSSEDRHAALERLVAAIAREPDDDAHRAVLVDVLQELGDPTGELIAMARNGKLSAARKRASLGPLAPYLDDVELVGGFPVSAALVRDAPDPEAHPDVLAAAVADFRLALIRALRLSQRASPETYARLVGAPRATALRRVDVSNIVVVEALIEAGRDALTHLDHIDFADAELMKRLAHPTFDRATSLHTVVGLAHTQPLMNRLVRDKSGFFKRADRRLTLQETRNRNAELVRDLNPWWPNLPIVAMTIGALTIERAGDATKVHVSGTTDPAFEAVARELYE